MKRFLNSRSLSPLSPWRVFLADDHPLVRRGLRVLIDNDPLFEICGEAATESEALDAMLQADPDIAVVDLTLKEGSGFGLLRRMHDHAPRTQALVCSLQDDSNSVHRAFEEGARGYLAKEDGAERILEALQTLSEGRRYLSPRVGACEVPQLGAVASAGSSPLCPSRFESRVGESPMLDSVLPR